MDWLKDAWDWIKGAASKVGGFLKDTKLLSKAAPLLAGIPAVGPGAAAAITTGLKTVGLGKKRSTVRRVRGGAMPRALPAQPVFVPQGTHMSYYPYAANNYHARF
jgi:hypothetical protein